MSEPSTLTNSTITFYRISPGISSVFTWICDFLSRLRYGARDRYLRAMQLCDRDPDPLRVSSALHLSSPLVLIAMPIEASNAISGRMPAISTGTPLLPVPISSSTGRWHEVHAHKVSLQKQPEGRVHVFNVSILPIMCGHFEYTIRIRAPKLRNPEWIWYSAYKTNGKVKVIRTANSTIFGLCSICLELPNRLL